MSGSGPSTRKFSLGKNRAYRTSVAVVSFSSMSISIPNICWFLQQAGEELLHVSLMHVDVFPVELTCCLRFLSKMLFV